MARRGTNERSPLEALTLPFGDEELAIYAASRRTRRNPIDWTSCAVLVIDVTGAFLGPRLPTLAASKQLRTACGLPGWEALRHISELLAGARTNGVTIVFTKPDWQVEPFLGGTTAGEFAGTSRPRSQDRIPETIAPLAEEFVLLKPKASAFFGTSLHAYLIRKHVRTVITCGSTTSGCVRATVVDAMSFGFDVVVASEGCFDRSPTSHAVSLFEMDAKYATVMTVGKICELLRMPG